MKHLIVDFLNRWKWWILLLLVFGVFCNLDGFPHGKGALVSVLLAAFIGTSLPSYEYMMGCFRVYLLMPVPRWKIGLALWMFSIVIVPALATVLCLLHYAAAQWWYGSEMTVSLFQVGVSFGLSSCFSGPALLIFTIMPNLRTLHDPRARAIAFILLPVWFVLLMAILLGMFSLSSENVAEMPWLPLMGIGWTVALLAYRVLLHFRLGVRPPLFARLGKGGGEPRETIRAASIRFQTLPQPWLRFCAVCALRTTLFGLALAALFVSSIGLTAILLSSDAGFFAYLTRTPLDIGRWVLIFATVAGFQAFTWIPAGLRALRNLPLPATRLLSGTLAALALGTTVGTTAVCAVLCWAGMPTEYCIPIGLGLPLAAGLVVFLACLILRWGILACMASFFAMFIAQGILADPHQQGIPGILREMGSSAVLPVGLILFILSARWLHRLIQNSSAAYRKRIDPFADMTIPR